MTKRYRVVLDLVLDEDRESALINAARQMFCSQGGEAQSRQANGPRGASADEVIDDPLSALMEITQDNPLFERFGIEAKKFVGEEINGKGDEEAGELPAEEEEIEDLSELDEFEAGVYLCRRPNGEFSIVQAESRRDAVVELDEWAAADAS
jgi:hypothetical protein